MNNNLQTSIQISVFMCKMFQHMLTRIYVRMYVFAFKHICMHEFDCQRNKSSGKIRASENLQLTIESKQ
jgi:hypothetical protein